jgi:hypothetical protein
MSDPVKVINKPWWLKLKEAFSRRKVIERKLEEATDDTKHKLRQKLEELDSFIKQCKQENNGTTEPK